MRFMSFSGPSAGLPYLNNSSVLINTATVQGRRIAGSALNATNSGITNICSMSMWVKANAAVIGGTTSIGGCYDSSSGVNGFGFRFNSTTTLSFTVMATATNLATASGLTPLNNWLHCVGVYDGSLATANIKIYVNGVLGSVTDTFTSNVTFNANTIFSAGNWFSGASATNTSIKGYVDEVALWNVALTPTNVNVLYNGGKTAASNLVSPNNLKIWWRCGDGDVSPTIKNYGTLGANMNGTMNTNANEILIAGLAPPG